MNGIFVECCPTFPVGSEADLKIFLEGSDPPVEVPAKGRVVRTTGTGMGMEIYEIPLEAYGHLKSLVLHNSGDLKETEKEFDLHQGLKKRRQ